MKRTYLSSVALGPVLLLAALLVPGTVAAAGPITSSACAPGVTPGTVTCDLWAESDTVTVPGAAGPITIWGFSETDGGSPTLPGPALIVDQNDVVTVNLTNHLSQATSITFGGQAMVPDQTGVATGASTFYTFTASTPGTYLYEAGLIPGSQYQVAMGMYGALIVRPAGQPTRAYADAATGFDDEALVVLGEIDPTLNGSTTPWTFDLRAFAPKYFLVNGAAYTSASTSITTSTGNDLLLRYVNAGIQHHSIGVLGLHQSVLAADGSELPYPRTMVAETIAPGQSADVLITMPATTAASTKYALYDAGMFFNNSNASGIGGMLAFIDASGGPSGGDTTGPLSSGVNLALPSGALSADVSDMGTGGATVTAAEYFIDTTGAVGSGAAMSGAFGSPAVAVNATIPAGVIAAWTHGSHTVYVRGRDDLGNWGAFSSTTTTIDKLGPATSALGLDPNPSSGAGPVALSGSASDVASGNNAIVAAEYFIGAVGGNGTGTAVTLNQTAPNVSLAATIPAPVASGVVSVHSKDAAGNWGLFATISLTVDGTGPATSGVIASPNPNNGTLGQNSSNPSVRVTAAFSDALTGGSAIATAEGFIDTLGAPGAGFPFVATDGLFNAVSETGRVDIPLTTIVALGQGNHTIHVRSKDAAGNWGGTATTTLVIDKQGPATSGLALSPSAANAQAVAINATASDTATGNSNIARGEYFIDTAGADGSGTALTVGAATPSTTLSGIIPATRVAALTAGTHTVYVHARDAAGNWGARVGTTLLIDRTNPTFSGISLAPNPTVGATTVTLTVLGSADLGGSGVTGGEWWFGTTNPVLGGGTAFNGLTASIPTAICPGTYTVRARIHDGAGNWSSGMAGVRSTSLTVTRAAPVAPAIFADGFELGTSLPCAWTSSSTTTASRLSVANTAAMAGTNGLQAQGNNTNYVQFNFATIVAPAAATYDARFLFNPNGNASTGQDILSTAASTNFSTANILGRVRYRQSAGQGQVQMQVGTSNANATWINVNGTSANTIEIVWQAVGSGGASPGTLSLYVNGSLAQTLTTTSSASVVAVRVGSVTNGTSPTLEYFDGFVSKSSVSPLVGP